MGNVEIFKEKGYCVIKDAVSHELRDFATQYALFDEMQDYTPDTHQVVGAHSKYADPAMESMLLLLHKVMEENTGLTLFPTYSFYRVYRPGDVLVSHLDRPSCEISATMCFNYNYDDSEFNWPIFVNGSKLILKPGDMAIYRGCDLKHWRDEFKHLDNDVWHVQGFFHFVDANGPYADYKYDKRNLIGEKKHSKKQPTKSYIQITG